MALSLGVLVGKKMGWCWKNNTFDCAERSSNCVGEMVHLTVLREVGTVLGKWYI